MLVDETSFRNINFHSWNSPSYRYLLLSVTWDSHRLLTIAFKEFVPTPQSLQMNTLIPRPDLLPTLIASRFGSRRGEGGPGSSLRLITETAERTCSTNSSPGLKGWDSAAVSAVYCIINGVSWPFLAPTLQWLRWDFSRAWEAEKSEAEWFLFRWGRNCREAAL